MLHSNFRLCYLDIILGAIHKRRLLKGRGRVKNVRIYLVKRQQRGREGGYKIGKMGRRRLWMVPYLSFFLFQYTPELLAQPELFKSIPDGQYLKVNVALVATLIYVGELTIFRKVMTFLKSVNFSKSFSQLFTAK